MQDITTLVKWFQKNQRPLPWRQTKDPYAIWISETMLQQTTSTAVIPYFERFLKKFPTLKHLAKATEEQIYEVWTGLGYYSRARNLLKSAQLLHKNKSFPQTYKELINYPGFGPYTSRSVSSLAFNEAVGVVDGNVIRVLSRQQNQAWQWWKTNQRQQIQDLVDSFMNTPKIKSGQVNQGLMELGATLCLPKNPQCLLCPWFKICKARKARTIDQLPLKKPKKEKEIWVWQPQLVQTKGKVCLIKNDYAPFLKQQWFLPGKIKQTRQKPKCYDFHHSITHYDIYVKIQPSSIQYVSKYSDKKWVRVDEVVKYSPTSLIRKTLELI